MSFFKSIPDAFWWAVVTMVGYQFYNVLKRIETSKISFISFSIFNHFFVSPNNFLQTTVGYGDMRYYGLKILACSEVFSDEIFLKHVYICAKIFFRKKTTVKKAH